MNVIIITTGQRRQLFIQTLSSLYRNAINPEYHTYTVVLDHPGVTLSGGLIIFETVLSINPTVIWAHSKDSHRVGASRARNIGASSIPKYMRQSHVMFIDDDVYTCPKWDETLGHVSNYFYGAIVSGHAHPYNHTVLRDSRDYYTTTVISTVHMVMPWFLWDEVGYFIEPGGPGGSEDVDYCQRTTAKEYDLVITKPHCVIHTGLTSSGGKPIVGADLVRQRNQEIEKLYGIEGKVHYQ